ncbi:biotin--[acetyl-CoA-carboxylase] ligase [Lutibacter sp. B1]|uniref:biotin--[acetyl-CoA-carboxylase] ligase n=1 Tax=Lutibacter sp. B1 TaxID=2725996 RepID=UPI001457563D|nr:biotin--[acetyl-CoA-carboxylase] ligase [Lutibacter sp. B1]NLP57599.1 biotin--[acetyl-CoA-carboxylase] ligase [Lutibacter sp. B1]
MNIIKLDAIDSTNSYIKKLATKNNIESYTIVTANHQTAGRGQMGTVWVSDKGKNLTFSVLIKFSDFKIKHQFYLSMAISLAILKVLQFYVKTSLYIKWPNDILAGKDKIAGILIENILSGTSIKQSVIGIGLNVNQKKFPKSAGEVISLKKLTGNTIDLDILLKKIIDEIKNFVVYIEQNEFDKLKEMYLTYLYKYNVPAMFENNKGILFLGKIVDIFEDGKLVVELEDEKTRKFNLKEIKFANK